jgi:hypothetical protein
VQKVGLFEHPSLGSIIEWRAGKRLVAVENNPVPFVFDHGIPAISKLHIRGEDFLQYCPIK